MQRESAKPSSTAPSCAFCGIQIDRFGSRSYSPQFAAVSKEPEMNANRPEPTLPWVNMTTNNTNETNGVNENSGTPANPVNLV
jgi:hypothetical protein